MIALEAAMASITIRNLDDDLVVRLRARAAGYGCSMEEEAREILVRALSKDEKRGRPGEPDSYPLRICRWS